MSGPKVDKAELRRQEQMRLEAKRERRKALANKIEKSIEKSIEKTESFISLELEFVSQNEMLKDNYDKAIALRDECSKGLKELLEEIKSGNELLNLEGISQKAERLSRNYDANVREHIKIIDEFKRTSEKYQEIEKNRQQLEQLKKKKIVRLSTKVETAPETISESDVQELSDTFQETLKEFMATKKMTGKHKNSILLIYQDLQEILASSATSDKKEKRIKRLFEEYQKMTAMINSEMEEMQAMYEEYLKESFDLPTVVMGISEFSSKEEIETAIKNAKETASANLSKEYIKRQIDEVMMKNGYDVVKSDMLSEMEQNGRVLYGVDNNTAIDVFVSDENQVTMRVVGIGFDSDISEAEDERLFQQQCAFCSMHPKITAELAMRGVILHTKKHMAPDKKFNKKIQTKTKNSSQSNSRAKKELKRTELKTMYRE